MRFSLNVLDPIIGRVLTKIVERSNVGVRKYGTTLADNPAVIRRWILHLQEELMDAMNYSERIMAELEDTAPERCMSCQAKEKQYTSLSGRLAALDHALAEAIKKDHPISVETMKTLRQNLHDAQAAVPRPEMDDDDLKREKIEESNAPYHSDKERN